MSVMTAEEAADYLKISRKNLYILCRNGEIPYARVGTRLRFSLEILNEWLNSQMETTA